MIPQESTSLASGTDTVFSLIFLIIVILLMVYAIAGSLFQHKHFHLLHETGLGIIIGWLIGGLIYWKFQNNVGDYKFNEKFFFYGLLPPIIFSGGYNLKKTGLFKNFSYISIFGILGTIVAFVVILLFTKLVNDLGWIRKFSDMNEVIKFDISTILFYSATICATDSVAALTMVKANKYPKLFSIIFGEGLVNDAVAIILFRAVYDIFGGQQIQQVTAGLVLNTLKSFFLNILFSLLNGVITGLVCTYMFKRLRFLSVNPVGQVFLIYLFGIFSYALAELLHFSGVISVLICAIVMAHFNFYNLSPTGQLSTGITFQTISLGAESFLFVYLGIAFWNYIYEGYQWSWTFILLQLVICTIGRFSSVFILSGLFYLCMKKKWKVGIYELGIIWFSGIIRGSVAFALILTVQGNQKTKVEVQIIKSSVLVIVFITTILLGAMMPAFIQCSLKRAENKQKIQNQQKPEGQHLIQQQKPKQKKLKGFKKFDEEFLKPGFIYHYEQRKEQIKRFKKMLKMNSPQFRGGEYLAVSASLMGLNKTQKSKSEFEIVEQV